MDNDLDLPSDHAPIAVTPLFPPVVDRVALSVRAGSLGDDAVLYSRSRQKSQLKRPIKLCNINVDNFLGELSRVDIPQGITDVDADVSRLTNILYNCACASKCAPVALPVDVTVNRWERLE